MTSGFSFAEDTCLKNQTFRDTDSGNSGNDIDRNNHTIPHGNVNGSSSSNTHINGGKKDSAPDGWMIMDGDRQCKRGRFSLDSIESIDSISTISDDEKHSSVSSSCSYEHDDVGPLQRTESAPDAAQPAPVRLARSYTTATLSRYHSSGAGAVPPNPGRPVRHPSVSRPRGESGASSRTPGAIGLFSEPWTGPSPPPKPDHSDDDDEDDSTFPEGGRQGWLVVFASFCALFCVFGIINTSAVFESWFTTHQLAAYPASQTGWIFSLYLFLVFFIGIQVGPLFDCYGPRWLVAVGSVLTVTSVMLLGLCTTYYQILLCYSVLGGLGGALLNTPAYACIAHFFNERRGLATGIATTAGGFGGILFPLLLQHLLPRLGFAWSTRVLGFILMALTVPANLWLRTRLPRVAEQHREEEEKGVMGSMEKVASRPGSGTDSGSLRSHAGSSSRRLPPQSVWPDFSIFLDKRYAVAATGIFFMEWGLFVPETFVVSYATAHGQSTADSYTLLALLNAGSVVGRFLPGLLADRYGRFNTIIVTIALSSAMVLGLWLPAAGSRGLLTAFAVLFGFTSGSNLGLIAVCLGQLCAPRDYGRFYSTAMMVASFGTLSSVPIGGALLGIGHGGEEGWQAAIAFSGAAYMLALTCYVTARVMAVGWRLKAIF